MASSNGNIRPLSDRVLVRPIQREETTKSGIVLPDTAKEKPQRGEVIAVGAGKLNDDGTAPAHGRQGRRSRPVREVRGHRAEDG